MGTQVYPDPNSQIPASFEKSLELAVKMLFEVVTSPTANAMLSGLAGALALAGVKNSCAVPLSVSALHQESVKLTRSTARRSCSSLQPAQDRQKTRLNSSHDAI